MRRTGAVSEVSGLRAGDHACWAFRSAAEHRRVLTTFFRIGLRLGDRLAFAGRDVIRDYLAAEQHDVDRLVADGRLMLFPVSPDATRDLDPDAFEAGLHRLVTQARADGYPGLRYAAEVPPMDGPPIRLAACELRADLFAARAPVTALCCYDAGVWGAEELGVVQAVHPLGLGIEPPGCGTGFHLYAQTDGSVRISGELDFRYADTVRGILCGGSAAGPAPVLDVTGLGFADVAGTRAIAVAARHLAGPHGGIRIRGASPLFRAVWRVLRFTDLAPAVVVDDGP